MSWFFYHKPVITKNVIKFYKGVTIKVSILKSPCKIFTIDYLLKNRFRKFKEIRDSKYIYQDELYKAFFQHDMTYEDFKNLLGRVAASKVLHDEAFNIVKNPKYDRYQLGLASTVYNLLDKQSSNTNRKHELILKTNNYWNNYSKQLLENLNKQKVHSSFIDDNFGANLTSI